MVGRWSAVDPFCGLLGDESAIRRRSVRLSNSGWSRVAWNVLARDVVRCFPQSASATQVNISVRYFPHSALYLIAIATALLFGFTLFGDCRFLVMCSLNELFQTAARPLAGITSAGAGVHAPANQRKRSFVQAAYFPINNFAGASACSSDFESAPGSPRSRTSAASSLSCNARSKPLAFQPGSADIFDMTAKICYGDRRRHCGMGLEAFRQEPSQASWADAFGSGASAGLPRRVSPYSNPSPLVSKSAITRAPSGITDAPYMGVCEIFGRDLKILKKIGQCANHVFIARHPCIGGTVIVKTPGIAADTPEIASAIMQRHCYILNAKPTAGDPIVRVLSAHIVPPAAVESDLHPVIRRSFAQDDNKHLDHIFMMVERLPGTLLDFWLHFEEQRYCVFTATSFLRDLLRICLWLEEHSLYLFDFKLENFLVHADGRLVLGDLDTVFPVKHDVAGRIRHYHSPSNDGPYCTINVHKMPFQAPEVHEVCCKAKGNPEFEGWADYTKAHSWSCAALIFHFFTGLTVDRTSPCSDNTVRQELAFLHSTGDARTDVQGRYLSDLLRSMLSPDPSCRPSTAAALSYMNQVHSPPQFFVDFRAKYGATWAGRMEAMMTGACPSGNPVHDT